MENNKEQALDDFLGSEDDFLGSEDDFLGSEELEQTTNLVDNKKVVMAERGGLIERVITDRILIDKQGRQLLREQY